MATYDQLSAYDKARLEERLSEMSPDHAAIVRAYYADNDAVPLIVDGLPTLAHDLVVRPYKQVLAEIASGWRK
jgi:hypothetical protein